jgi:hypothetical protein
MSESESEEEILVRIEAALMKISTIAHAPRATAPLRADDGRFDRAALVHSLDLLIARLRAGLEPHAPAPTE